MLFCLRALHGLCLLDELTPLIARLEKEKTAKEEAIAAKNSTERKSREFITEQRELVEKLQGEKVSSAIAYSTPCSV